ncbi:DsrE family protein [Adhaeribacter aquaticus]|uniref:DsrE family protein n=1 Tax=Adhaeribacter aquaticus TaxID=299567 RepID=UPI0003FDFBE8|nr:DsrE family protein [Adhaeribacter aquaticus]
MRFFFLLFLSVWAINFSVDAQAKKAPGTKVQTVKPQVHRVVYDVTNADTTTQAALIRQLNNLKRVWPTSQVEVVVHGKGLDLVLAQKSYKTGAIKELQQKGVVFAACENTMRFRKVSVTDLLPGVITVQMGVGEIIMKQEQGWSYIKY